MANDTQQFVVVVNHEDQYSIWAVGQPIPIGWRDVGVRGDKQYCLSHIAEVWTDMRPKSLRVAMGDSADENSSGADR